MLKTYTKAGFLYVKKKTGDNITKKRFRVYRLRNKSGDVSENIVFCRGRCRTYEVKKIDSFIQEIESGSFRLLFSVQMDCLVLLPASDYANAIS